MCHRNPSSSASSAPPSTDMPTSDSDLRPAAVAKRSRTRTRKPKFLSLLRIDLPAADMSVDGGDDPPKPRRRPRARHRHHQLNLFPLHPETSTVPQVADDAKVDYDHDNVSVSLLFNGDDASATDLSGLLDGAGEAAAVACSEEGSVGSHDSVGRLRDSTCFGGVDHHRRSSLLVRAAMKSGGRDDEEEKWVSYSEVVERKPMPDQEPEEVSSCSAAAANSEEDGRQAQWPCMEAVRSSGGLLLKLDYKEVLNSWSDKGSLFIEGNAGTPPHYHLHQHHEAAQIVPEINSELVVPDSAINNGPSDGCGSPNLWTVPDHKGDISSIPEDKEGRFRRREASVLRYKEKRQNRLFAKRIRYEVRKLNAEKRPRIKGRFVRRNCGDE